MVPLLGLGHPTSVQTALLKTSSIRLLAANVTKPEEPHEHDMAETDMMSGIKKDFVSALFAENGTIVTVASRKQSKRCLH
jgi:hypothetical protein